MKADTPRYIRFILNEDIMGYNPKADKTKKTSTAAATKKEETPDLMEEILKLAKEKTV
jgi:hypothetical protein